MIKQTMVHYPCELCYVMMKYFKPIILDFDIPNYLHEFLYLPDGVHLINLTTNEILWLDKDNPYYNTPREDGPRTISLED